MKIKHPVAKAGLVLGVLIIGYLIYDSVKGKASKKVKMSDTPAATPETAAISK